MCCGQGLLAVEAICLYFYECVYNTYKSSSGPKKIVIHSFKAKEAIFMCLILKFCFTDREKSVKCVTEWIFEVQLVLEFNVCI